MMFREAEGLKIRGGKNNENEEASRLLQVQVPR